MSDFMNWIKSLPGARPVDQAILDSYRHEMVTVVIPAIEEKMKEQQVLNHNYRVAPRKMD